LKGDKNKTIDFFLNITKSGSGMQKEKKNEDDDTLNRSSGKSIGINKEKAFFENVYQDFIIDSLYFKISSI